MKPRVTRCGVGWLVSWTDSSFPHSVLYFSWRAAFDCAVIISKLVNA